MQKGNPYTVLRDIAFNLPAFSAGRCGFIRGISALLFDNGMQAITRWLGSVDILEKG
jgi:hypothetical protein